MYTVHARQMLHRLHMVAQGLGPSVYSSGLRCFKGLLGRFRVLTKARVPKAGKRLSGAGFRLSGF